MKNRIVLIHYDSSLFVLFNPSLFSLFTYINMKYLIVGLGNIGDEYRDTRHNIGFNVVDALAKGNAESVIAETKQKVVELCKRFPIYE